jgi:hypothetical protein
MNKKEVLERAFRALDDLAGPGLRSNVVGNCRSKPRRRIPSCRSTAEHIEANAALAKIILKNPEEFPPEAVKMAPEILQDAVAIRWAQMILQGGICEICDTYDTCSARSVAGNVKARPKA